MPKIQYVLIAEPGKVVLEQKVETLLKEGWQLAGGVSVTVMSSDYDGTATKFYYTQALVRHN